MDKVNHDSPRVTPADMAPLRDLGWTDEAIYFTVTVCALFNFYNKWIDGSGVSDMPAAAYTASGRRLATRGYAPQTAETT